LLCCILRKTSKFPLFPALLTIYSLSLLVVIRMLQVLKSTARPCCRPFCSIRRDYPFQDPFSPLYFSICFRSGFVNGRWRWSPYAQLRTYDHRPSRFFSSPPLTALSPDESTPFDLNCLLSASSPPRMLAGAGCFFALIVFTQARLPIFPI